MWKGRTVARVIVALCLVGLAALALVPSLTPLPQLEYWTADWRTAFLSDRAASEHPRLAVVLIDDDTLEPYAYLTPTDRSLIREIILALQNAKAAVVGLDFFFVKKTETEKDDKLVEALRAPSTTRIVVGFADKRVLLSTRQRDFQTAYLGRIEQPLGYLNLSVSPADGVVRHKPKPAANSPVTDSFAQAMAKLAGAQVSSETQRIAWLLPATGASSPFLIVRGQDLLTAARDPATTANVAFLAKLRDRIVLIGGNFPFTDQWSTPLSLRGGGKMPGVLVHAQMVAELLDGRQVNELSWRETQALLVGMWTAGCLMSWLASRHGFRPSRWTLGAIFLVAVDVIIFARWRIVLPFTLGMAAWILGVTAGQFITQMKLRKTQ
jgi:adenylate cyclase